jgi:hypothetical protein
MYESVLSDLSDDEEAFDISEVLEIPSVVKNPSRRYTFKTRKQGKQVVRFLKSKSEGELDSPEELRRIIISGCKCLANCPVDFLNLTSLHAHLNVGIYSTRSPTKRTDVSI